MSKENTPIFEGGVRIASDQVCDDDDDDDDANEKQQPPCFDNINQHITGFGYRTTLTSSRNPDEHDSFVPGNSSILFDSSRNVLFDETTRAPEREFRNDDGKRIINQ